METSQTDWPQEWREDFAAQNKLLAETNEEPLTAAEYLECRRDDCAELDWIRKQQLAAIADMKASSGWRLPTLDEALVALADFDLKNGSTLLRLAAVLAQGVLELRKQVHELEAKVVAA